MTLNLHTPGNGLLETHISWDDIEKRIQEEKNLKLSFGPKKRIRRIGEGEGVMSRVAVIEPDYQEAVDGFPEKFVIKMVCILGLVEIAKLTKKKHGESVGVEEILDKHDRSARLALRALAYLEAKSLELSEDEKRGLASNYIPIIMPSILHPAAVSKFFNDMYTASDELKPTGEILEKMAEELAQLELTSTMNRELGMKDVFVHGDLWSTNLLWNKEANGLELKRMIDYQLAHFGCPAEDLCRMFISTLSAKDRRENWEHLLDVFYGYIRQYCKGELPFTLEQLKESYQRMFPTAGVLLLPVFSSFVKVAALRLNQEEKIIVKKIMSEKTLAFFEDVLYFARRNREVRRVLRA